MKKIKFLNKKLKGFYLYKVKWYSLVVFCLTIIALLNGKILEAISFLMSYTLFRYIFPSTLHLDIVKECILSSIVVLGTGIVICFSKEISIFSSVLCGFIICMLLYIVDYIYSLLKPKIAKSNRDKIIAILKGNTSQDNIFTVCRNNGLKEDIADAVDLFLNNTLEETAEVLGKDIRTIQRKVKKFIEKCYV